jgi:gluconate 5-dehydrogenase
MSNPFSLENEVALITGGGTGLGHGIARCMAAAGAKVVLVGRREAELKAAAAEIGERAFIAPGDVTQYDALPGLIATAEKAAGAPISILVNNAGIHLKKPAVDSPISEFETVIRTHLFAAYELTRLVLPGMIARGHGNILFTASMATLIGLPLVTAYSAAKSAYGGVVRSLAAEVSCKGVRINAIAPGWIESPMLTKALSGDDARKNKILGRTPMGKFGQPDDIGNAAVYLCSPAAAFVTGVVLPVDGGASIGF